MDPEWCPRCGHEALVENPAPPFGGWCACGFTVPECSHPKEYAEHIARELGLPWRAISLKQPWAWAVFNAGKNVENRTWWTEYRGPIWLASSAQVTRDYYEAASNLIQKISGVRPPDRRDLVHGAILGRVTVSDCILPGGHVATGRPVKNWPAGTAKPPEGGARHPLHPAKWHFPEQFGYVLDDLHALATPVPCKGLQRFWRVPADVLEQLKGEA